MSSTYLPPANFIEEVKKWGITKGSLNKVRMMGLNEFVYCKITLPQTSEEIWTRIRKEDNVQLMDLKPVAVPAIWINEGEELIKIEQSIKDLEVKNANTTK